MAKGLVCNKNPSDFYAHRKLCFRLCGMEVEESKGIKSVHKGKTFYFCSSACKQSFEANPSKFLKK